ncbi:CMGC/SRPK protein kinase [[Emmonsia] crescens]|uniref:CMGC/SRPK protein kinase n=1 Tax=[Emmonsia] crescens TaxID=73230 RepID=A0A2B7ZHU1_9EURO|nr:CMGC/SRPK protein kinase [Emmonsia crescens]
MMRPSLLFASRNCLRRSLLGNASFLHARRAQGSRVQLQPLGYSLRVSSTNYFYTTMASDLSSPLKFPNTGFDSIDASEQLEEETLPNYNPANYYPAHLGQVLVDRYQIVGKLGYGVTSTVWLGRDLLEARYVTLKISTASSKRNDEINIYKQLDSVASKIDHVGQKLYRKLYDSFEVTASRGTTHTCLVQEPLGLSLEQILDLRRSRLLTTDLLKPLLRQLLIGLDFLHVAGVVHTDLQSKNLLLQIDNTRVFKIFEETELKEPAPRKILEDHTIYMTRRIPGTETLPIITDFGEARLISKTRKEESIMPDAYRAPEAILWMEWDDKVDIWSVAVLLWDLVSNRHLFHGRNSEGSVDESLRFAEMIAIMGPPPKAFLKRSDACQVFWDENVIPSRHIASSLVDWLLTHRGFYTGRWRNFAPIPDITLESLAADIEGDDKKGFLNFLRKILRWLPEERPTAGELVYDEWVLKGLGEGKGT